MDSGGIHHDCPLATELVNAATANAAQVGSDGARILAALLIEQVGRALHQLPHPHGMGSGQLAGRAAASTGEGPPAPNQAGVAHVTRAAAG